jgi:hypothetical protein
MTIGLIPTAGGAPPRRTVLPGVGITLAALLLTSQPALTQTITPPAYNGWGQTTFDNLDTIDDSACNYLYLTDNNQLLYYGTSGHCRARQKAHLRAFRATWGIVGKAAEVLPGQYGQLRTELEKWSRLRLSDRDQRAINRAGGDAEDDDDLQGAEYGSPTADSCIALHSDPSSKPKLFVAYLDDAGIAEAEEKRVLKIARGLCNTRGTGGEPKANFINNLPNGNKRKRTN